MSITWIDYGYEYIFSYMVTVDVVYHFLKVLQHHHLENILVVYEEQVTTYIQKQ